VIYRIDFTPAARRQFRKLAPETRKRLAAVVDGLATEPRPRSAVRLSGGVQNVYRLRHGDYRIVYELHDDRLVVLVIRIGHRREVYRNLR
jgi:mRNA interferase RelE/StbE